MPADKGYVAGETHGLIAAAADQSAQAQWSDITATAVGSTASGEAVGTGQANTRAIVDQTAAPDSKCTTGAAKLCDDLVEAGYADWYLPSWYELEFLRINREAIKGFVSGDDYWSSTESSDTPATMAVVLRFTDNDPHAFREEKDSLIRVRAVRSF